MNPQHAFAQRLRMALASADFTKARLAKDAGVSPAAVSKWCEGKCYPAASHLQVISNLTGASVEWLMWPRPVDIRSTDYAPDGVHVKALIREAVMELAHPSCREAQGEEA